MIRTGIGFDAHRFSQSRPLVLGGVRIRETGGLDGHSDADVLCHAVIDALLGAMSDGDIGRHFPDSDERWRGASSIRLLNLVKERITSLSGIITNIDATVIAETPKLVEYVPEMCAAMAEAMDVPARSVSVKATTVEGMGAFGRSEGIGAMAVATIEVSDEIL